MAARLVTKTPGHMHITPVLKHLHWLPIRQGSHGHGKSWKILLSWKVRGKFWNMKISQKVMESSWMS